MHAARAPHLAQEHRAELACADQADGHGPAGSFAFEQQCVQVHEAVPPFCVIAREGGRSSRRRIIDDPYCLSLLDARIRGHDSDYWQIARETKDSSLHSW